MRRMKRTLALLLVCAMCLGVCACGKTVGSYRVLKTLGTEQFRIGFRQDDQAAAYVDAALRTLAAEGTVHTLAIKWFGADNVTFAADAGALDALGDVPARTFIMGVSDSGFPMSYADGDGYAGFDVELARAVCERLGWTLQCQSVAAENAYVELSSGNVDCVWGGMVLEPKEQDGKVEKLKFAVTEPYLTNELVLVTRADTSYSSVSRLKGVTVMLDADAQYVAALQTDAGLLERFGQVDRVTGGAQQCFEALQTGDCAAIVTDSVALAYYTH